MWTLHRYSQLERWHYETRGPQIRQLQRSSHIRLNKLHSLSQTINNGIQCTRSRNTSLCQKTCCFPVYRRNIQLSQINICRMSNHSQIALNKFINITNPYVLCINETKKDMTSDKFYNYTVVSAINGNNSQGVAMLIHSSLPYLRIYDLENIHFDSIWIVTVLSGKKIVMAPHIFNPTLQKKCNISETL